MNLSIVIPVFNEHDNLPMLFDAIYTAMKNINRSWEVVFVDDGSRDNSLEILQGYAQKDPEHIRVVSFRRNCRD
jgi:dolichol-phosphate mannosyltransferase